MAWMHCGKKTTCSAECTVTQAGGCKGDDSKVARGEKRLVLVSAELSSRLKTGILDLKRFESSCHFRETEPFTWALATLNLSCGRILGTR